MRSTRVTRSGVWVLATAILHLSAAGVVDAQQRAWVAEGRVTRPVEQGPAVPVRGIWVVLHRVGSDRAAPLDSVRSGADGSYRISYRPSGSPDALYFVSATYSGIAYFSPPLRRARVRGEDADVVVYDTTPDTSRLRVQGRHFVLSAPRGSAREVVEVYEVENEGVRTIVARDSTTPIMSVPLPGEARGAAVTQGDISAGAVVIRGGRADVFSPLSPGVHQMVITYTLPVEAFPLALPVSRATSVLEVLLEEPRATVEGANLAEVASATIENRIFRRFLAQDAAPSAVMRVSAPSPVPRTEGTTRVLVIVMALAMLGALGAWLLSRRGRLRAAAAAPAGARAPSESERLIAELATLDASFERYPTSGGEARQVYEQERAQLKDRIARALAAEEARS